MYRVRGIVRVDGMLGLYDGCMCVVRNKFWCCLKL